jgi:GNAT superfamily N-acetyltransferase
VSEPRTAAYEPARLDAILALMEKVYGEAPPREEFTWWFDGNPTGPRTVVLAESDDRLAGVLGASFYRTVVEGEETLVALPLWAATDPDFRGQGIFQRLNAEVERAARAAGATLELGFTNKMAGPIYVSKLAWLDVHRLRVWARPLAPLPGSDPGTEPQRFTNTDEEAYRRVASALRSHFVRDVPYLNWRFADAPRGYRIVRSANGYAVVGRKRLRGMLVAYVADLVAPTVRETLSLLRRCARVSRGSRLLLALPNLHRAAFAAFGFVPTPMTIRLIGHGLDRDVPLGPDAWRFALGDTDFF